MRKIKRSYQANMRQGKKNKKKKIGRGKKRGSDVSKRRNRH